MKHNTISKPRVVTVETGQEGYPGYVRATYELVEEASHLSQITPGTLTQLLDSGWYLIRSS